MRGPSVIAPFCTPDFSGDGFSAETSIRCVTPLIPVTLILLGATSAAAHGQRPSLRNGGPHSDWYGELRIGDSGLSGGSDRVQTRTAKGGGVQLRDVQA